MSATVHDIAARLAQQSRQRVAKMAATGVAHLRQYDCQAEKARELEKDDERVSKNLEWAFKQFYAFHGKEEAEKLIPWVQSKARPQS